MNVTNKKLKVKEYNINNCLIFLMCLFPTVNMAVDISDHTVLHGLRLVICRDTESI